MSWRNTHTNEIYEVYEADLVEVDSKGKKKKVKQMMMKWLGGIIDKPSEPFKCVDSWNRFGTFTKI